MEKKHQKIFTLWLFNITMENGPFIDDFPINTSIYKGFSIISDWWFQTFGLCSIIYGMSSFSLTFIFFKFVF